MDVKDKSIDAVVVQTFKSNGHVDMNELMLKKVELNAMNLFDLKVTSLDVPVDYVYNGQMLEILWQKPFQTGESRKIEIKYKVKNPVLFVSLLMIIRLLDSTFIIPNWNQTFKCMQLLTMNLNVRDIGCLVSTFPLSESCWIFT